MQTMKKNQSLPIEKARQTIVKIISENESVIIMGETGSGKTTRKL